MRLLYVADAASIHTRRWAEAFRDRGGDVHVASFRPATIDGVSVHRLPTGGLGKAGYLLAVPVLRRLAATLRPDVVHAMYVTSYGFLAAAAGLRPLVTTAWGSDVLISPQQSRLSRWFAARALAGADHVTTVAAHMNAAVQALGVPAGRATALPFGVDTALFRPPAAPRPEPPPLRVICTRNFAPVYSVHTVVEAVRLLRDGGSAVQLDLVGAGPLRGDLEAAVHAARLQDSVAFHGHVGHPRLVALLGAAHVFVSAATSDGNNVSLNEAMACGCLPVATDIAANAQWLTHGRNGLLFAPGDARALADGIARAGADGAWRAAAAAEKPAHRRRACRLARRGAADGGAVRPAGRERRVMDSAAMGAPLIVFGTGAHARKVFHCWRSAGGTVAAFRRREPGSHQPRARRAGGVGGRPAGGGPGAAVRGHR